MRDRLVLSFFLTASLLGCGGNVNVGPGGDGGGSTTSTTSTTGSTSSTSTSTSTTGTSNGFDACDGPGQCVIVGNGCCPPCGLPGVEDVAAVNEMSVEAYQEFVCPKPITCPDCPTAYNPNLFGFCDGGKCFVGNVPTNPVSECTTSDECRLRNGSGCCEGCGDVPLSQLVAVSINAMPALEQLVCAPDVGCPECLATYPPEASAICDVNGHCAIIVADSP